MKVFLSHHEISTRNQLELVAELFEQPGEQLIKLKAKATTLTPYYFVVDSLHIHGDWIVLSQAKVFP